MLEISCGSIVADCASSEHTGKVRSDGEQMYHVYKEHEMLRYLLFSAHVWLANTPLSSRKVTGAAFIPVFDTRQSPRIVIGYGVRSGVIVLTIHSIP
jgi:hypothetical protein